MGEECFNFLFRFRQIIIKKHFFYYNVIEPNLAEYWDEGNFISFCLEWSRLLVNKIMVIMFLRLFLSCLTLLSFIYIFLMAFLIEHFTEVDNFSLNIAVLTTNFAQPCEFLFVFQ